MQDPGGHHASVLGGRADVVDGVELAGERLGREVGGLGCRRAALERGLGRGARIGVAATDPRASADRPPLGARAARPSR